jgi:hypothetical protein
VSTFAWLPTRPSALAATGMSLAEAEGLRAQLSRLAESLDAAIERLTPTHRHLA